MYRAPDSVPLAIVTGLIRPLLRAARALFWALLLLGVMVQPVLSAVQDLHEWEHAQVDVTGDASASTAEVTPTPGTLDGLLHAFDCLHATALTGTGLLWSSHILRSTPPRAALPLAVPSPLSRFLRPPIAA